MAEDSTVVDEIDVWYRNPNTGGIFGFGLPLPEAIAAQVRTGALVPAGADSPILPSSSVLEAAGTDGDGTGEDEAILHPCLDCGDTAVRDEAGQWLEHCATHVPKPPTQRRAKP